MHFQAMVVLTLVSIELCSGSIQGAPARSNQGSQNEHHKNGFILDLTHTMDMVNTPTVEGGSPLEMSLETQDIGFGTRSQFYEFCMDERLGTHVNAPSMFLHLNGTQNSEHIPLQMLVNVPAIVIDLHIGEENRSSLLSRRHLDRWELEHGKIPVGSFVLLRTGWADFYGHADKFLGNFNGESNQVFPGFSGESASWLLSNRDISGLGTECIDVELGWKTKNQVKQTLASQNKISVVQLTNLAHLPPRGFSLIIAPLKLKGGSGGPARVFAVKHPHQHQRNQNNNSHRKRDEDYTNLPKNTENNADGKPSPAPPFKGSSPSEHLRSSSAKLESVVSFTTIVFCMMSF